MTAATLLRALYDAGAAAAAVVPVEAVSDEDMALYDSMTAEGRHASMSYLERYGEVRRDPALLLDGARSMLIALFDFGPNLTVCRHTPLQWASYALGDDYHDVIRRQLGAVGAIIGERSTWRVCVDTAPLRERYHAVRAGLGFTGRNGMLIVPGAGSALFIGTLLTCAELPPLGPLIIHADGTTCDITAADIRCAAAVCDTCGVCLRSCPGHALRGDGSMDARRCLSYLTIEHRGPFADPAPRLGRHIYGCDICLQVCPHNRGYAMPPDDTVSSDSGVSDSVSSGRTVSYGVSSGSAIVSKPSGGTPPLNIIPGVPFAPRKAILSLTRGQIATMTPDQFSAIFRHSPIKRATLAGLRRNAACVQ